MTSAYNKQQTYENENRFWSIVGGPPCFY